jgi:hypothetical protein
MLLLVTLAIWMLGYIGVKENLELNWFYDIHYCNTCELIMTLVGVECEKLEGKWHKWKVKKKC